MWFNDGKQLSSKSGIAISFCSGSPSSSNLMSVFTLIIHLALFKCNLFQLLFETCFFSGSLSNLGTAYLSTVCGSSLLNDFLASATVGALLRGFAVYLYQYDSFLLPQQVVQSGLLFSLSAHLHPHELGCLVVESWCTSKILSLIAGNQAIHRPPS